MDFNSKEIFQLSSLFYPGLINGFLYLFQVDDFVLVELEVEGRKAEDVVHYVGQVREVKDDGHHVINFLRINSHYTKDSFHFPDIQDELLVPSSKVLGVLTRQKGSTHRQATLVKIYPPPSPASTCVNVPAGKFFFLLCGRKN